MRTEKLYPAKCLVDFKTKKPIMLPHGNTKGLREIEETARKSAKRLAKALKTERKHVTTSTRRNTRAVK